MNLATKFGLSALFLAIFNHSAMTDNEFSNKCPEFNPQNELDIELVS